MINHATDITMRQEEKYICPETYLKILESRLSNFLDTDSNQGEDGYEIRSLYFDTISDRMYEEGIEGLEQRNKYRIRIYNGNTDVIKLEKKISVRSKKKKKTFFLEKEYVDCLLANREPEECLEYASGSLISEFTVLRKTALLRPRLVVEYDRKAYINDIGNIRITLDRNIRVTDKVTEFFEKDTVYHPILPQGIHLLEVKYDGILPGYLVRLLNFEKLERTAFSKYVLGRQIMKNNGRISEKYEF